MHVRVHVHSMCVCAVSVSVSECAAWACSHTGDARAMPAPIIQDMMSGRDSAQDAIGRFYHPAKFVRPLSTEACQQHRSRLGARVHPPHSFPAQGGAPPAG